MTPPLLQGICTSTSRVYLGLQAQSQMYAKQARTLYTQAEVGVGWAGGEVVKARSQPMGK